MAALRHVTAIVLAVLLLAFSGVAARADGTAPVGNNLLVNGDFSKGSVDQPDEWRTEAWLNSPETFAHHWVHPAGGPNQLEVDNLKANDARWEQAVSLPGGFYYLSAEVRTENVGANADGASISIMSDGMMSPLVRGTSDWQRVGFYFRVGPHGADIDVALRVGGYGSLNSGRGFFRDARLVRVEQLPAAATPFYDWDAIQKAEQPKPVGKPWTLTVVLMALGAVIFVGWRLHGTDPVPVPRQREARRARGAGNRS